MINPRLSVDAMCSFNWSFEQDLALWKELGVRHAGLLVSKLGDDPAARIARVRALRGILTPEQWRDLVHAERTGRRMKTDDSTVILMSIEGRS